MTGGRGEPGTGARGNGAHEGDLEAPGSAAPDVRRRSAELFARLHAHPGPRDPADGTVDPDGADGSAGSDASALRRAVRDELVHLHLPLVEHCARRFRNRGEPLEDLVQVGTIGLLKAIDRFEAGREVEFSTYAMPTIVGEIKRYFRDKGWAIRVPRRLQELRHRIGVVTELLSQELGRSPTARELAAHLGCSVEEVVEGLDLGNAYTTLRLDPGDELDEGPAALLESLGVEDANLENVEFRESIRPLLEGLGAREKRILLLRFFRNHTQAQIAEEIGVSQMHVSRLLNRTLLELRVALEAD